MWQNFILWLVRLTFGENYEVVLMSGLQEPSGPEAAYQSLVQDRKQTLAGVQKAFELVATPVTSLEALKKGVEERQQVHQATVAGYDRQIQELQLSRKAALAEFNKTTSVLVDLAGDRL